MIWRRLCCYNGAMREDEFAVEINKLNGRAYLVGGYVRDLVMGREPHDRDYVVCGAAVDAFAAHFPRAPRVGKSFPVFLVEIDGEMCEVAFARTEVKSGSGYTGFAVSFAPDVTIEEDLYRRDTTMNAMAISLPERVIIDPYGGRRDIADKTIRAVSAHFSDDPVRALRAARQAAQFGFSVDADTLAMMSRCAAELAAEPKERVVAELERALESPAPSVFFRVLRDAALLDVIFPWIHRLIGKTQPPEYHPEGDAFEHTMMVLDDAARRSSRVEVRFAALMHDAGKGLTPPDLLPHHYGHEEMGLEALRDMNRTMTLPARWRKCAEFAIKEHMRPRRMTQPGKVVDLLARLERHPLGFDGFSAIIMADNGGENAECLVNHEMYVATMRRAHELPIPQGLTGEKIGQWIRQNEIKYYLKALHDNIKNKIS